MKRQENTSYELAAAQGHALAQYNLGLMYEHGNGVAQDYEKVRHYYELAAAQGHDISQYNLGKMYNRGIGTTTF